MQRASGTNVSFINIYASKWPFVLAGKYPLRPCSNYFRRNQSTIAPMTKTEPVTTAMTTAKQSAALIGFYKTFLQLPLALGPEEGYEPCGASASTPLFCDIAAEDEAEFKYGPELALVRSLRTKDSSLRGAECIHPREIAAKVHASLLVGWRRSDSGACAPRSK